MTAGVDVPIALTFTDQWKASTCPWARTSERGQTLLTVTPQPLLARTPELRADVAVGRTPAAPWPAMHEQEQTLQSQVILYGQLVAMAEGQTGTVTSPIDGQVLAVNVGRARSRTRPAPW